MSNRWLIFFRLLSLLLFFDDVTVSAQGPAIFPESITVSCRNTVDLPIKVNKFSNMLSMQGSVQWDISVLQFEQVSNFGPTVLALKAENFGTALTGRGKIIFSWNDLSLAGISLPDSTAIFILRFKVLAPDKTSTAVSVGNDPVPLEFINANYEPVPFKEGIGNIELLFEIAGFNPLINVANVCGENYVLNAGSGFSTYSWNTGVTNQMLNVNQSGLYIVKVKDSSGCTASDSSYISIVNAEIVENDTVICKGESLNLNTLTGNNLKYRWSTGDTSSSVNIKPEQNTIYLLTVNDGITYCTDSVRVNVNSTDSSLKVVGPLSFCQGEDSVRIEAGENSSYQWLLNGQPFLGATARTFMPVERGEYRVVLNGNTGCTDTSRSVLVNVKIRPSVKFGVNTQSQCLPGNIFRFSDSSSVVSGQTKSWHWDFGDGSFSIEKNPAYFYNSYGNYTVSLLVSQSNGCSDSAEILVSVFPKPLSAFTISTDSLCLNDNLFYFSNSTTGDSLIYRWNFGDGKGLSVERSPTYRYTDTGSFTVTLQTTNPDGCTDTLSKMLRVFSDPVGDINVEGDTTLCEGSNVVIRATGGYRYRWYRNNVLIKDSEQDTLQVSLAGIYNIEIVTVSGCTARLSKSISISLIKKPKLNFTTSGSCVNPPIFFRNTSTFSNVGKITWIWNFGDGNGGSRPDTVSHKYEQAGNYTVVLGYGNSVCPGHVDSIKNVVHVFKEDNRRYRNVEAVKDRPVEIQARNGGTTYLWSPATGLNNTSLMSPTAILSNQQEYKIRIALDNGCTVTDTVLVRVMTSKDIYVPRAFSPNSDGQNDRLFPVLVGIRELKYFRVFNRWGVLVFESKDMGTTGGWDGFYKGAKQPMEAYVWIAEGVDIDGVSIKRAGNTLLIR